MTERVIVTGAAGFIGRNVVAELNRRGPVELILVDDLGTGEKWRNLGGLRFEDILAPSDLWGWLADGNRVPFHDARPRGPRP